VTIGICFLDLEIFRENGFPGAVSDRPGQAIGIKKARRPFGRQAFNGFPPAKPEG